MDFHHLKYFVEVADKKSFSKAARTLHISQSAISRTIKALEEELGVVLFMRNAKAVELTDAGTIFLSHAKRVVVPEMNLGQIAGEVRRLNDYGCEVLQANRNDGVLITPSEIVDVLHGGK